MAVKYQDYYQALGVPRDATQEQIQAAYRKLARKMHPDVNKESGAEERFKEINEAYEVLKDPEKRKRYDELGANWRDGQEFTPPPNWAQGFGQQGGPRVRYQTVNPSEFGYGGFGDDSFSDFFASLFGGMGPGAQTRRAPRRARGEDIEGDITIPLEEAYRGATRAVTLSRPVVEPDGRMREELKTYDVRIPPGTTDGTRMRLSGLGGEGEGGGQAGDLYIRVHVAPHPLFKVDGHDLTVDVAVTPWEAALGAEIPVPTLDGSLEMKLPSGTSSGRKLRLRGQGLPNRSGKRGDLFAQIRIEVPHKLTERERELFEELGKASKFNPRTR